MKKLMLILAGGGILCLAGFGFTYSVATSSKRSMEKNSQPEMAWLKQAYQLSDQQYTKACQLYAAYHPKCLEMCREIDAQNARLQILLAQTNVVTPEIRQALVDVAQLRANCEANMLAHFYAMSQAMPPQQGQRYLAWMQKETLMPSPMAVDQTSTPKPLDNQSPQRNH